MTLDEMRKAIEAELRAELEATEMNFSEKLLASKVANALREVMAVRKYPAYYASSAIEADMEQFYGNIRDIAMYDYSKAGVDFQESFSENGGSGSYVDRDTLFSGVIPLAAMA